MNIWKRIRLGMETKILYAIIPALVLYGLFFLTITTELNFYLYLLVFWAGSWVTSLIIIAKKTDNWWYNEYDDNEWGHSRDITKYLQGISDALRDREHK